VKWSHWQVDTIPGAMRRIELEGARMLFSEECPAELSDELLAQKITRWPRAIVPVASAFRPPM
jgi:hypothetical protein